MTQEEIDGLYDLEVRSVDGDRLGPVRQVYLDDRTGRPAWIAVHTGWFGHREHPVPLSGAERTEEGLRVSVSGEEVREAPTVEPDEHLGPELVAELRRYYALEEGEESADAPLGGDGPGVWREEGSDVVGDGTLTPEQAVTGAPLNILRGDPDELAERPVLRRHERP
ncbi:PRC-barrel domain-containing protein [Ornithinimicrobium avium]|uniref:PRC-barrel domain-containing protein n=1 Tax=Ornithinimicrobium avium TaxID=2283195 RepID=UPI0013B3B234|nr:PRC-barrel domain-containing protein [Ornithinimicrobium avium]